MKSINIFDYLLSAGRLDSDTYDLLKYSWGRKIYNYGEHAGFSLENAGIKRTARRLIRALYVLFAVLINTRSVDQTERNVISNAYFNFNKELRRSGYNVYAFPWNFSNDRLMIGTRELAKYVNTLLRYLEELPFNEIVNESFLDLLRGFGEIFAEFVVGKNIVAAVVPSDVTFFENFVVKSFRKLGRNSFIFLHGLPGRYNSIDENRSNFLIVWGEKIRQNYMKYGFDRRKIIVTGHPNYKEKLRSDPLRNTLEDVLVLTKAIDVSQFSDRKRVSDRGNSLVYLFSVQNVLVKLGIGHARFRPHPSENVSWYEKGIDMHFYRADRQTLEQSLKRSSLVIGPASSVLLEALYAGVNYQVYEFVENGVDLLGFEPVPPFDGSDRKIPVAHNDQDLKYSIRNKATIERDVFYDYIHVPFQLDELHSNLNE